MNDFRALAEAGRWEEANWMWLSHQEKSEFLELVRDAVPVFQDENGMERIHRHAYPHEVEDDKALMEAATILHCGELEAAIEGEPPDDIHTWSEIRSEIEGALNELAISQEVTEGEESLSRKQHAADALDY